MVCVVCEGEGGLMTSFVNSAISTGCMKQSVEIRDTLN